MRGRCLHSPPINVTRSGVWLGFAVMALVLMTGVASAETNPASILFDRDIKPIFEQSCLRCHGAERPKSGFRLTDRESVIKGGDSHSDVVVPGNSMISKLVQFVSGQPEDMLMPPADQGERLTPQQINLLRQWIDEGAIWGAPPKPEFDFSLTPAVRWIDVQGDKNKFRALESTEPGWDGGLEEFSLTQQLDQRTKLRAEGHYWYSDHDGAFRLSLDRRDVGFVRFGLEQWRSYYDDTGGFYRPAVPPSFDLNQELALDHGRAWIDFGLALPDWPLLVLGYEYRYRDGEKDTLQWGFTGDRNIYPSAKQIDEALHILKFDLTHESGGWVVEDSVRVEFYDLGTSRDNVVAYSTGPRPDLVERAQESVSHVFGMNTLRVQKDVYEWWQLSGGYLFSRYDGESRLNQTTLDFNSLPTSGQFWSSDDVTLRRDSQVVSAASLFQPMAGFSAVLGAQGEWSRQEGAGDVSLDTLDTDMPEFSTLRPAKVSSNLDRWRTSEHGNVRFTSIPWTVLYGEARLDQERASQFESLIPEPGVDELHDGFLRDTDYQTDRRDWRAGFTTSPVSWLSFGGNYRRRASDNDYDHDRDFHVETNGVQEPGEGYSAFILAQETKTDAFEARVVLRPLTWMHTTLTYRRVTTDFTTTTDPVASLGQPGGTLDAATYDADVYSANFTIKPWQRLYLTASLSYSDTRTVAADNANPSVVPYEGDVYSVLTSARFVLTERTDLFAAYNFSKADYGQDNYAEGLPLGMEFTRQAVSAGIARRLTEACVVSLRYAYYQYDEPSSRGVNDYTAHGIFATLNYRWQ